VSIQKEWSRHGGMGQATCLGEAFAKPEGPSEFETAQ
jgi:hypothetical protein